MSRFIWKTTIDWKSHRIPLDIEQQQQTGDLFPFDSQWRWSFFALNSNRLAWLDDIGSSSSSSNGFPCHRRNSIIIVFAFFVMTKYIETKDERLFGQSRKSDGLFRTLGALTGRNRPTGTLLTMAADLRCTRQVWSLLPFRQPPNNFLGLFFFLSLYFSGSRSVPCVTALLSRGTEQIW